MMKKKYFKPEMQVYEVGTHQILVGSPRIVNDDPDDGNDDMW